MLEYLEAAACETQPNAQDQIIARWFWIYQYKKRSSAPQSEINCWWEKSFDTRDRQAMRYGLAAIQKYAPKSYEQWAASVEDVIRKVPESMRGAFRKKLEPALRALQQKKGALSEAAKFDWWNGLGLDKRTDLRVKMGYKPGGVGHAVAGAAASVLDAALPILAPLVGLPPQVGQAAAGVIKTGIKAAQGFKVSVKDITGPALQLLQTASPALKSQLDTLAKEAGTSVSNIISQIPVNDLTKALSTMPPDALAKTLQQLGPQATSAALQKLDPTTRALVQQKVLSLVKSQKPAAKPAAKPAVPAKTKAEVAALKKKVEQLQAAKKKAETQRKRAEASAKAQKEKAAQAAQAAQAARERIAAQGQTAENEAALRAAQEQAAAAVAAAQAAQAQLMQQGQLLQQILAMQAQAAQQAAQTPLHPSPWAYQAPPPAPWAYQPAPQLPPPGPPPGPLPDAFLPPASAVASQIPWGNDEALSALEFDSKTGYTILLVGLFGISAVLAK